MIRQSIAFLSLCSMLALSACLVDTGDEAGSFDPIDDVEDIGQIEQAELSRAKECWCEQWTPCPNDYPFRVVSQECYYSKTRDKCASKCTGYCRNDIGAKGSDIKGVCKNNFGGTGCEMKSAGES